MSDGINAEIRYKYFFQSYSDNHKSGVALSERNVGPIAPSIRSLPLNPNRYSISQASEVQLKGRGDAGTRGRGDLS